MAIGENIWYRIGQFKNGPVEWGPSRPPNVSPNGDLNQPFTRKVQDQSYDSDFHLWLTVNKRTTFVGVHESGNGGRGIYYRIGHLNNDLNQMIYAVAPIK